MSSSGSNKLDSHVGPYILTSLLDQVPLAENGQDEELHITCVEFWGELEIPSKNKSSNANDLLQKTTTCTLELPLQRFFTTSLSHQTPRLRPNNRPLYWLQDYVQTMSLPRSSAHSLMVSSKSWSCQRLEKHVCYATQHCPSTCFLS